MKVGKERDVQVLQFWHNISRGHLRAFNVGASMNVSTARYLLKILITLVLEGVGLALSDEAPITSNGLSSVFPLTAFSARS